ncbi:MAG: DUF3795 domain-containing protein [Chloroflexi bacterium]|nr:DUF3795 domain-containing protein [Chloroflexota bacterium]
MNQLIAFCGLDCAKCDAYIATQANDEQAKQRVIEKWRVEYNSPNLSLADATCDGCTLVSGRHGGYCGQCPIRACGVSHNVANCAHCADYNACDKLADFFKLVPDARVRLDQVRSTL